MQWKWHKLQLLLKRTNFTSPCPMIKEKVTKCIVVQMLMLIFPLHTLKPCCARKTSETALEKQDKCSMAGSDLFTRYATPITSDFFHLSFCNPIGINRPVHT